MDSEDKSEETAKGEGQPTVESVFAIAKEKLPGIVAAAIRQASENKRGKLPIGGITSGCKVPDGLPADRLSRNKGYVY